MNHVRPCTISIKVYKRPENGECQRNQTFAGSGWVAECRFGTTGGFSSTRFAVPIYNKNHYTIVQCEKKKRIEVHHAAGHTTSQ